MLRWKIRLDCRDGEEGERADYVLIRKRGESTIIKA